MALENLAVQPEVTPESPEYLAEMERKGSHAVDGGEPAGDEPEIAPKPEGIPDKFYNAETGVVDYTALAKSYVELEKAKGKPPTEAPKENPKDASKESAEEAVKEAGLDLSELSAQYATDGDLSEENYAKLAKAGFDKAYVDTFIEGQKAMQEVARTQAFSVTEGADGYSAMVEWAAANSTPEDIQAYNEAVNSRDSKTREAAVKGLWASYTSDSGETGANLITSKTNSKVGDGSYQSRAEMMADMKDPRYKADEAFRSKVQGKLANSNIL